MTASTIPSYADRVDLMAVCGTRQKPSQFAPTVKALVSVMTCPACSEVYDDPGVSKTLRCSCGLSMQCTGASVFIWRDLPKAAE